MEQLDASTLCICLIDLPSRLVGFFALATLWKLPPFGRIFLLFADEVKILLSLTIFFYSLFNGPHHSSSEDDLPDHWLSHPRAVNPLVSFGMIESVSLSPCILFLFFTGVPGPGQPKNSPFPWCKIFLRVTSLEHYWCPRTLSLPDNVLGVPFRSSLRVSRKVGLPAAVDLFRLFYAVTLPQLSPDPLLFFLTGFFFITCRSRFSERAI